MEFIIPGSNEQNMIMNVEDSYRDNFIKFKKNLEYHLNVCVQWGFPNENNPETISATMQPFVNQFDTMAVDLDAPVDREETQCNVEVEKEIEIDVEYKALSGDEEGDEAAIIISANPLSEKVTSGVANGSGGSGFSDGGEKRATDLDISEYERRGLEVMESRGLSVLVASAELNKFP